MIFDVGSNSRTRSVSLTWKAFTNPATRSVPYRCHCTLWSIIGGDDAPAERGGGGGGANSLSLSLSLPSPPGSLWGGGKRSFPTRKVTRRRQHDGRHRWSWEVRQPGERPRSARHQSLQGRGADLLQPGVFLRAVGEGEKLLLRLLLQQVSQKATFISDDVTTLYVSSSRMSNTAVTASQQRDARLLSSNKPVAAYHWSFPLFRFHSISSISDWLLVC